MSFLRSFFGIFFMLFSGLSPLLGAPEKPHIKVICWDLCYTLCKPSSSSLLKAAGMATYGLYTTWDGKTEADLRRCVNHILAQSGTAKGTYTICDIYGNPCSLSMEQLFMGKTTAKAILKEALQNAKKLKKSHYFYNKREYNLCINILNFMLDPANFAASIEPYTDTVLLLEHFSDYDYYLCALWDAESFKHLSKNKSLKEVLSYFEDKNCFISGHEGIAAPDPVFYKAFLEKYGLKAEECLVVDDQIENVKAAEECGMHAIHCIRDDLKDLRKKMGKLLS